MGKKGDGMQLKDFFAIHEKCAVALSGGTDSAYLLYAAVQHGCDVRAYYMCSEFQPEFEYEDARKLAEQLGVSLQVLSCHVLEDERIRQNPPDRCYYCKQKIFQEIQKQAEADGYCCILDGTNASDKAEDRPGMKALAERKVLSPLRLCGITKAEVRRRSREAGLFTSQKPSYACLATRIATGHEIQEPDLQKAERAEAELMKLGLRNFRVRMYRYGDSVAALETEKEQWQYAKDHLAEIQNRLRPWFADVILEKRYRETEEIFPENL